MPIPTTKKNLIAQMELEYDHLLRTIESIDRRTMETVSVVDNLSIKDLLAHRLEWMKMVLDWYQRGLKGKEFNTPADDLKWNQLAILNQRIYEKYQKTTTNSVVSDFKKTFKKILKLTKDLPEKQLFQNGLYPWMRSWPLSRWIVANTSSHFRSAAKHIRNLKKTKK